MLTWCFGKTLGAALEIGWVEMWSSAYGSGVLESPHSEVEIAARLGRVLSFSATISVMISPPCLVACECYHTVRVAAATLMTSMVSTG